MLERENRFEVGDRVKVWFRDKWNPGVVIEIRLKQYTLPKRIFDAFSGPLSVTSFQHREWNSKESH